MTEMCAGLRSTLSMADINEGFVKNTESTFGKPDDSREAVRNARRVVVKVLSVRTWLSKLRRNVLTVYLTLG